MEWHPFQFLYWSVIVLIQSSFFFFMVLLITCFRLQTCCTYDCLGTSVLCISTSFWVLRAPKNWLKHFSDIFQSFLFISKLFSVFTAEITEKRCLLLKAGRHAKAGRLLDSLKGYPKIVFFGWFFGNIQPITIIQIHFSLNK